MSATSTSFGEQRTITVKGTQIEKVKMGLTEAARRRLLSIGSPIGLLLLWEIAGRIFLSSMDLIPIPSIILTAMVEAITTGQLWTDLEVSLYRILLGFLLGVIPGLVIGLSMGLFPIIRSLIEPFVASTYPIPKLAIMPLLMIVFGMGETEKIVLILLGVIYPVIINTASGVIQLNKQYLDVAKNFGASRLDYYRTVAIPGALPAILTGLKIGLAEALLLIVAAEMIGAQSGIGYRIWMSYEVFNMPAMFVSFLVLSLLGYLFSTLMDELEHWLIPWKRQ